MSEQTSAYMNAWMAGHKARRPGARIVRNLLNTSQKEGKRNAEN